MVGFVTFVGFLIHLYSVGYMHGEPDRDYARYFGYLNLFMFAMLTLVTGSNLPVLFVGWEGVGLCSYLLIGFYFEKDWCAAAGMKAFIVNRIGDFGFLLAIFFAFYYFGTLEFQGLFDAMAGDHGGHFAGAATIIGLLLFVGAIGKSAQIPLFVWLPDAMAGPTPVSALIHAATMVTAGVYMVARCNYFYQMSPTAMLTVAVIGGVTAVFAATIGLVQNDIKKVLAYSTVSQLGYMFLAAGVGAYVVAIFHVVTHAFFKACLFLGSGSVIHACGGEQDMRKMGGLKKYMPTTYWTFLVATIAIAGIFPFAGFFSKDEILAKVFAAGYGDLNHHGGVYYLLWALAVIGAILTAFYMFRLVFMTFHGDFRGGEEAEHHLHESPWTMTLPLQILGVLSIIGGFIGVPGFLWGHPEHNLIDRFLEPVVMHLDHGGHAGAHPGLGLELGLIFLSLAAAGFGIWMAYRFYYVDKGFTRASSLAARFPFAYKMLLNKYWVDELYDATVIRANDETRRFPLGVRRSSRRRCGQRNPQCHRRFVVAVGDLRSSGRRWTGEPGGQVLRRGQPPVPASPGGICPRLRHGDGLRSGAAARYFLCRESLGSDERKRIWIHSTAGSSTSSVTCRWRGLCSSSSSSRRRTPAPSRWRPSRSPAWTSCFRCRSGSSTGPMARSSSSPAGRSGYRRSVRSISSGSTVSPSC